MPSATGLSTSDLVTIVLALATGIGAILAFQHKLITSLLKDRWEAHEEVHKDLEKRVEARESEHSEIALKVNTLETVCRLRAQTRENA